MRKGIKRTVRFFSDVERKHIHEASKQVLETTGLLVRSQKAREIFQAHGCSVDTESSRVRIPGELVDRAIRSFGTHYTFTAREPEFDIALPENKLCITTASSASKIIDFNTGELRNATSSDIASIARLMNELPGFDIFSIATLAADAPEGQFSLSRFYPALKYCNKPIRSNTMNMQDLLTVLEFGYTVAGSREAYLERPFINHHYCPVVSPLTFDVASTEAVTYILEQGLPVYATVCPSAGMSSPMSMVGNVVVGNAEFLAINTYFQMVREGAPVLYACLPTIADMRTGNYTPGSVECAMLEMAHTEMAQFYGVPSGGYIGQTDSHALDAQAGQEVAMSNTAAVLAGASLLNMGGLLDSLVTFDYTKLIMDNEVAMNLKRLVRGMEYDPKELRNSLEEIEAVGPGGVFMTEDLTLENTPTICFYSDIASKDARISWGNAGSPSLQERSKAKVERLLAKTPESLFTEELESTLRKQFPSLVTGEPTL